MYESFSQDTKTELGAVRQKSVCCRRALLYGMLYGAEIFSRERIFFDTENPSVLLLYGKLIRGMISCREFSDADLADLPQDKAEALLSSLGFAPGEPLFRIKRELIVCPSCAWAFVRGVFLSCGTVTAPGSAYHLEFLMRERAEAEELAEYLASLDLSPKLTERGGSLFGVYFKDSESIVDLLGHIGANRAAFDLLNVKIYRDIRNNVNRVSNCELANLEKTVAAANEQMKAIEAILSSGREKELPEELRQTLDLRAAFPDATLSELAGRHTPPITKSGVNHRLKRLIEFSKHC